VKTNVSEYTLAAIFSIITEEKEVHLVTFHSYSFKAMELNCNMHNKELLMVFKAFYIWHHYLKELECLIDVITDHKNLEYFLTTKFLSCYQARWLEFLSQFNLVVQFYLRYLELKLDAITYREDFYLREGRAAYNSINLQNMCPVFIHSQLFILLQAIALVSPNLWAATIVNLNNLYNDIQSAIMQDKILEKYLYQLVEHWLLRISELLLKNRKIYILQKDDLHIYILQYHHDHILVGHFRQNKTLELICHNYIWPFLHTDIKKFCNSCVTYIKSKL